MTLHTESTEAQCARILAALAKGRSLTAQDALDEFRCFRLAARIYDLRQDGHNIATITERHGDKRWGRYVLLGSPP